MMPDLGAQAVSNIIWSSAKLGFNPDVFVPGIMHSLTKQCLQLMSATTGGSALMHKNLANLVWALATMHHAATTHELLDLVY